MPATSLARHRASLAQLVRFGLVGGSGVLVNMGVVVTLKKSLRGFADISERAPLVPVPGTPFNIRWYHLIVLAAFLVAVVWNFQLNRSFTFRSAGHARWWSEFRPFFLVGSAAALAGAGIVTALMNPASPLALPRSVFDESSGLRTPFYWAQALSIVLVMPVNFLLSKVWAFKAVRPAPVVATSKG